MLAQIAEKPTTITSDDAASNIFHRDQDQAESALRSPTPITFPQLPRRGVFAAGSLSYFAKRHQVVPAAIEALHSNGRII